MSGVPSWARKGMKVVCINDQRLESSEVHTGFLVAGSAYTIDGAYHHPSDGRIGLFLAEAPGKYQGHPVAYDLRRFRPAVEPKTEAEDLAQFRKLLTQNTPELVE
jgi:hypothetical protein